ncbi:hypothetical protein LV779_14530 [Streptomyces thinghirensis]|nr:hypothetical protein [Streptomyces thinghirensis]
MLQGVHRLPEEYRDDYWTLVAYHHSLRELGRTVTAAGDDIPAQLRGLGEGTGVRELVGEQVQQLDSSVKRADQPILLDRLEKPWTDPRSVSFLPCTNMLSVGVDVSGSPTCSCRASPKPPPSTSRPPAASAATRCPDSSSRTSTRTRPRDRSHYETFIDYHRALYRYVEPASVTPWSLPARRRALHAALVILVRHRVGLAAENQAGRITDHKGRGGAFRRRPGRACRDRRARRHRGSQHRCRTSRCANGTRPSAGRLVPASRHRRRRGQEPLLPQPGQGPAQPAQGF